MGGKPAGEPMVESLSIASGIWVAEKSVRTGGVYYNELDSGLAGTVDLSVRASVDRRGCEFYVTEELVKVTIEFWLLIIPALKEPAKIMC
jgi:hypothetical protein